MDHQFSPPTNEKDFERFCCDLLRTYWPGSNPQKWGRSGQKQLGVDVIDMNAVKPLRGGQAKFRKIGSLLTPQELEEEVIEARKFNLAGLELGKYTVLTTCENDIVLQGRVVTLNHAHREQGLFEIELLTWEMIEEVLREHPGLWERAIGKSLKALVDPITSGISEIQRTVAGVKVQIEEIAIHSSVNSIDSRLVAAKSQLDAYRQQEAELLLSSVRANEWAEMLPYQRFRTLSLLGRIAMDRGDQELAGRLFIEGAQHFQDDERAKTNRAVGLDLVGDHFGAYALARALAAEYPNATRLWAVICRTASKDITAAVLEEEIPPSVRNDDEVLVALALRAWTHSDWVRVARYSEAATRGDADWAVPWTQLGQAKLQLALQSAYKPITNQVCFREHEEFEQALQCFDRSVDIAERTHCQGHLIQALLYRARARALDGDIAGAKRDFADATRYAPQDPIVLEQYGRHLLGYDGASAAVTILRQAVSAGAQGDAKCALAVALCNLDEASNRSEYTALASEASQDQESCFRYQALDLALQGMVRSERFDDAESFLDSLERLEIPSPVIEAGRARILLGRGETDVAQQRSQRSVSDISVDSGLECRRFVADTLTLTGNYPSALVELIIIADQSKVLPDAWDLVDVAKRLGRHDVIRDVCRRWREAGVKDVRLIHEELVVLERYEPQYAVTVIQQLLEESPNDVYLTLRLSLLGIRLGQAQLICSDPARLPSFVETHPKNGVAIVRSLIHGGNSLGAVEFAYRLLRRHPRNPEANANFAWSVLLSEHTIAPTALQSPETVKLGSAFSYVEPPSDRERWLVVEDDSGDAAFDDELNPGHSLSQKVLGLRPGTSFLIDGDEIDGRKAVIKSLASKFAYRASKIMQDWQVRFPDLPVFQMFHIEGADDQSGRIPDLTPFIRRAHQHKLHSAEALTQYREAPVPLHMLSSSLGLDDADTIAMLALDSETTVRCCSGFVDEFSRATASLLAATHCVVDITAVTTLRLLDLERLISEFPIALVVSTATLTELLAVSNKTLGRGGVGSVIPVDYGIGIQFVERSEEEIETARQKAQAIVTLLQSHAEVRDCRALADMPHDRREMYIKALGQHTAEAIVLASSPGHVLWTDDLPIAQLLQNEFGARRTWTQAALHVAALRGVLHESEYNTASSRLMGFGYQSTRFSIPILRAACELSDWTPSAFPLKPVIKELSQETNSEDSTQLALAFVIGLFTDSILHVRHVEVAMAVLNGLASRPVGIAAIRAIRKTLPMLLRFNLGAERALREVITRCLMLRGEE